MSLFTSDPRCLGGLQTILINMHSHHHTLKTVKPTMSTKYLPPKPPIKRSPKPPLQKPLSNDLKPVLPLEPGGDAAAQSPVAKKPPRGLPPRSPELKKRISIMPRPKKGLDRTLTQRLSLNRLVKGSDTAVAEREHQRTIEDLKRRIEMVKKSQKRKGSVEGNNTVYFFTPDRHKIAKASTLKSFEDRVKIRVRSRER